MKWLASSGNGNINGVKHHHDLQLGRYCLMISLTVITFHLPNRDKVILYFHKIVLGAVCLGQIWNSTFCYCSLRVNNEDQGTKSFLERHRWGLSVGWPCESGFLRLQHLLFSLAIFSRFESHGIVWTIYRYPIFQTNSNCADSKNCVPVHRDYVGGNKKGNRKAKQWADNGSKREQDHSPLPPTQTINKVCRVKLYHVSLAVT